MEIVRDRYLNKLLERKENGLVKVVTGIRRCGKSYCFICIEISYYLWVLQKTILLL